VRGRPTRTPLPDNTRERSTSTASRRFFHIHVFHIHENIALHFVVSSKCRIRRAPSRFHQRSFRWHEHRRALVFDQEHDEFCRLVLTYVPPNDMNIIGAFGVADAFLVGWRPNTRSFRDIAVTL
jgi:hypothetical protein